MQERDGNEAETSAYKAECITNKRAHDIIICAVDCTAITPAQTPDVLMQWPQA